MSHTTTVKYRTLALAALAVTTLLLAGCAAPGPRNQDSGSVSGLPVDAAALAAERGLTPADIYAALKTYHPSGTLDEYVMIASAGHAGQVFVIGVPSMRILKTIGVFTPEPWQGWGYGAGNDIIESGYVNGKEITWGDTHHPALSETKAEYDGQYVFINDKANARIAVIDLRDFETKQIVKNPNAISDHGGTFVTPNTEYIVQGPQYGLPLGWEYAPLEEYEEKYRGYISFWSFDRGSGRIDMSKSFQLEVPPYWQDLCDAGKGPSDGYVFCNSFNTELSTGMDDEGSPPFETGASKNDMDFLHIIDWKKAEAAVKAGKATKMNGIDVLSIATSISEKILHFTPEPKSPHGADVTPGGEYVTVSGKLDPHVAVYSVEKIKAAIAKGTTRTDQYGIPILEFDDTLEKQVEVGLGPLHTVYDNKGYAYTSLFLDSAVARWTLGGPYDKLNSDEPWKLIQKLPVQYNIGHLTAAEGDTASPDGKFLVALNKWSIDRFQNVGPLLPQNLQLVDIERPGDKMQLLYDMPMGIGEPHYAQIIKADKLNPYEVYPKVGWDPHTMSVDPDAVKSLDDARVERDGDTVHVYMPLVRSHFTPERVEIKEGDHVVWHLTNLDRTRDASHGFQLSGYNIQLSLEPGETQTIEFDADRPGTFTYYCTEFCSALHLEMVGYLLVEPTSA